MRAKAEERAPERPREMAQEVGNIELEKALEELLADASFDCVRWVKMTTSTQDLARSLVRMSEAPVTAVHVADGQSAGRGTHGRRWRGAQGTLMLTITAPLAVPLEECSGLAPAVGIAAARALRSANSGVGVKWPNDLWLADGKLAGILCETCRDKAGGLHVAAGIGVNIALDSEVSAALAAGGCRASALFSQAADSLSDSVLAEKRLSLAALLARTVAGVISGFSPALRAELFSHWPAYDAFAGRRVRVFAAEGGTQTDLAVGVDCGISPAGELIIETDDGRRRFATGSLRPL